MLSRYPVEPDHKGEHHFCRCPVCGHLVDEEDIEEVLQHIDDYHAAPTKH